MKSSIFILAVVSCLALTALSQYTPDWKSLDKRPLPQWYDDAKIGIFIHWGVFSVPSFKSEWFWNYWNSQDKEVVDFMNKNYPPGFTYADFANQFTAEFFNPDEWASILSASGAKYVVLTSKHHEGYCLWPSKNSFNWNSMDVGPKRDLVGDLANSIRKNTNITFGLYHSLLEWYNPLYLGDKASGFKTQDFVNMKTLPELYDIVNKYKPEVIWSDGDWEAYDSYWNSTQFIAWLYNESPVKDTVVVNDRWGVSDRCQHGDIYTCDDNYNPKQLLTHKWENCMTIDSQSWGYRRNLQISEVRSIEYIITSIAETISCGGNILINIGPTKEGHIAPIFEERLRQLGSWLDVNGEAVYSTRPWKYQNDTTNADVWYTSRGNAVYAILLKYPDSSSSGGKVVLSAPVSSKSTTVSLLGYSGQLQWTTKSAQGGILIDLSTLTLTDLPCKWAWVFKLVNV